MSIRVESALPQTIAVGDGTALFVYGSCFHRAGKRIRRLRLAVDGAETPVMATEMPRLDLFNSGQPYRSGFWAVLPLPAIEEPRTASISAVASLDGGGEETAQIATVDLEPGAASWPDLPGAETLPQGAEIAVCMATYEPTIALFERQIESIRSQTLDSWICVISDDATSNERFEEMLAVIGDDERFVVSRSTERLGFYRNFERALAMVPPDAELVALSDHDDHWYPEKLETLRDEIGDANLVYSDARIVAEDGSPIADTFWTTRRNNYTNLASLLIANTVTGAASLFRRDLLDHALPFPPRHASSFHDNWIALVALALGDIAYVDRPLYDYVQHGAAEFGHGGANQFAARTGGGSVRRLAARVRARLGARSKPSGSGAKQAEGRGKGARKGAEERPRQKGSQRRAATPAPARPQHGWRSIYFFHYCRMVQVATALRLRTEGRLTGSKRRALERFLRGERSPRTLLWLFLRPLRRLAGRRETFGFERALLRGIAWRHVTAFRVGRRRVPGDRRVDARMPPQPTRREAPRVNQLPFWSVRQRIGPIDVAVRPDAPERVNFFIPTMDVKHFFGAYIGKFNLAKRLADRGIRTRIVAVDPTRGHLPPRWKNRVEAYRGLEGFFSNVEVAFARDSGAALEMNPRDTIVATTTWTAHVAHRTLAELERSRFLYLIQEYDPLTYPAGSFAAITAQAYSFPHFGVFSTELLRDYFRRHGIGVFANGAWQGDSESVAFENAITPVDPPTVEDLSGRDSRRLLFYARPEEHARRNMFELGIMALSEAAGKGVLAGYDLNGVGSVEGRRRMNLGNDAALQVLPRRPQDSYGDLLRSHDVGLALMHTPHPSLVPIEMASAGMLVVTNSFENKTPEAMAAISENLITVEPTLDGVVRGLREATERAADAETRVRGAAVNWSRDWETSYNDEVMSRVVEFLAAC